MNHVARTDGVQEVLRIVRMERIFHRIKVIQIAEEFIEAVNGGEEFIPVAQVVFPELAGSVSHRL